jgi:PAS domain-containing protein
VSITLTSTAKIVDDTGPKIGIDAEQVTFRDVRFGHPAWHTSSGSTGRVWPWSWVMTTAEDNERLCRELEQLRASVQLRGKPDLDRFTQFAVEHLSGATYWMEEDATIIYVNEAASRLTGYSLQQLRAMNESRPRSAPNAPGSRAILHNCKTRSSTWRSMLATRCPMAAR